MLKVINRATRAKNQADKVLIRFNKKKEILALKDGLRQEGHTRRVLAQQVRTSRQETKEDRILGPLAPRRAVSKEEAEEYGAIPVERFQTEYVPMDQRIRYWDIVIGDRVVILKGHDRHKIGSVKSVDKKRNEITVEGLNMAPVATPEAYITLGKDHIGYHELPVKYHDVRLVYPLPDPETGILKDTIIANIKRSKIWTDKKTKARTWDRLVPGIEGITIPWPEKEAPKHIDQLADTRSLDVDTTTFTPTLLIPPMPVGVIDELRNKYSKFRTRHDTEYIEKKEAEESEKRKLVEAKVLTPIQEINKKLREEKKALGRQVLSDEMLEKIGRIMAQNRPETLASIWPVPAREESVM